MEMIKYNKYYIDLLCELYRTKCFFERYFQNAVSR